MSYTQPKPYASQGGQQRRGRNEPIATSAPPASSIKYTIYPPVQTGLDQVFSDVYAALSKKYPSEKNFTVRVSLDDSKLSSNDMVDLLTVMFFDDRFSFITSTNLDPNITRYISFTDHPTESMSLATIYSHNGQIKLNINETVIIKKNIPILSKTNDRVEHPVMPSRKSEIVRSSVNIEDFISTVSSKIPYNIDQFPDIKEQSYGLPSYVNECVDIPFYTYYESPQVDKNRYATGWRTVSFLPTKYPRLQPVGNIPIQERGYNRLYIYPITGLTEYSSVEYYRHAILLIFYFMLLSRYDGKLSYLVRSSLLASPLYVIILDIRMIDDNMDKFLYSLAYSGGVAAAMNGAKLIDMISTPDLSKYNIDQQYLVYINKYIGISSLESYHIIDTLEIPIEDLQWDVDFPDLRTDIIPDLDRYSDLLEPKRLKKLLMM